MTKGAITQDSIERCKAASVTDVVGHFVSLKNSGAHLVACCPFHNEKTPSFTVTPAKNRWQCFGACDTGGNAIDFVQQHKDCDFRTACETVADLMMLNEVNNGSFDELPISINYLRRKYG